LGDRVIATFGALASGDRLSGLIVAFDGAEEVARCSPGELLVIEVVRSAIERGFHTFDLGVGESRYKSACCETPEPLFDTIFATSPLGRAAAPLFRARQTLKGRTKRSPVLMRLARRLNLAID
jgi:CelD/BcsL family acetyltransferase involved in cellulose biosynthesis